MTADGPIVVGGFYRSGTSLVRRILDGHSRIACGPESKFWMDVYGLYRHDDLSHLRLFRTLRTLGADDELLVDEFGAAYLRVLDRLTAAAGKARWADKAPENVLFLAEWARLVGPDFPFVHCVRDPLDTLASAHEANFRLTLPEDLGELIATYRRFVEAGLAHEQAQPDRCFRVRYEELVTDPERVVGALMAFLGEGFEAGALELDRPGRRTGLEDPKIAGQPRVHADSIGRHRAVFTPEQVDQVRDGCADLATRLGYAW